MECSLPVDIPATPESTILVSCQTLDHSEKENFSIESASFDEKPRPDIRGIISYEKLLKPIMVKVL